MSDQEDDIIGEDDDSYVPSRILNEVRDGGQTKYLIEWEDWPYGAATIEPKESFDDNPGLFEAWEREKRRRRLGKTPPFDMAAWREVEREWNLLPKAEQLKICATMTKEREDAEALGNYGEGSPSGGTSDDEADEGPIYISDDPTGAPKKKIPKFKNRPLPESSDDESDEEDSVAAPKRAKTPLRRPTRTANDNVGVTGYQGNANRAPLPPRREGESKHKKPVRATELKNKARREGERKPQKMQDKIAAAAAGKPVNNGSKATFRNMSTANRAHRAGQSLADRAAAIPGTLRAAVDGKRVNFTNPSPLLSSTKKPAAQAQAPPTNRIRESGSPSDDAWDDDDDDALPRLSTSISTALWPRMPPPAKPTEKEMLEKREEALQKQISDARSAIENARPISDSFNTEEIIFNARRTSGAGSPPSSTLFAAPSSHGLLSPTKTLGAIADGTAAVNTDQARSRVHAHRPKTDPLFCQSTKERITNRDRVPRTIIPSPAFPQAATPAENHTRSGARPTVSFQEYQATRKTPASINTPPTPFIANPAANDPRGGSLADERGEAVYQIVTAEMLGCSYSALLPHLTNPKRANENAYYYLLFPAVAGTLADNITKWLRNCSKWAKVFHCQQPGSWTRFVELTSSKADKLNGGCLIVHNSLKGMIPRQPQLTKFLQNGENGVWCADETAPYGKVMTNVFRQGGAILITPRVFESQPQKAHHILDWFFRQKLPQTRGKIWKLALLHGMTSYLENLWQRSAKLREDLVLQYRQAGESEQTMLSILESRALSKKDIESMHQNLRLVQKIKQHGVRADAIPGTKEAETVFVELSSGVKYEDDERVVEGFSSYALTHWQGTRKWVLVGTGESQNKDTKKKEPHASGATADASTKEQRSNKTADKGQSLQSPAESLVNGAVRPVTTDDNVDRTSFTMNTGVGPDVADEYLKKSLGDLGLALRFYHIDLRDGNVVQSKSGNRPAAPQGPDNDGDTAMEDVSTSLESSAVEKAVTTNGTAPLSGAAPPTPPDTSSPSKLHAEIQARKSFMEDNISSHWETGPPPPPENMPPPPPAKIRFSIPSPNAPKKSQLVSSESRNKTTVPAANEPLDVDMLEHGEVEDLPEKIETRPTLEWYHDRQVANTDYKHIFVINYEKAVKFFNIPVVQKQQQQQQQH